MGGSIAGRLTLAALAGWAMLGATSPSLAESSVCRLLHAEQSAAGESTDSLLRLETALRLNDCTARDPAAGADTARLKNKPVVRNGDVVEQNTAPAGEMQLENVLNQRFIGAPGDSGERFATLCVRTCDGYTFPMSTRATISDFQRDQKGCESACPGTETKLYYRLDSGRLVSAATGQPYERLNNAGLFRQPGIPTPKGCTCAAGRMLRVQPDTTTSSGPKQTGGSFIVFPEASAAPAAPEAQREASPPAQPGPLRELDAETRDVRVVGPRFVPDPSAAEAPRVQAPAPDR